MDLTEKQLEIIESEPLDNTLYDIYVKLNDPYYVANGETVASIFLALLSSNATLFLPLFDGRDGLPEKLIGIRRDVLGGSIDLRRFRSLLFAIEANAPDTEIWTIILELIHEVNPMTPPQFTIPPAHVQTPPQLTIPPAHLQTPPNTSSSRSSSWLENSETKYSETKYSETKDGEMEDGEMEDNEMEDNEMEDSEMEHGEMEHGETCDIVETELYFEVNHCTHRNVPGFFQKYFDSANWSERRQRMLKLVLDHHDGTKWKGFPVNPWEEPVWDWLTGLEEAALAGAPHTLHRNKNPHDFIEREGQMDMFFQNPERTTDRDHTHVLVVGEHERIHDSSDFKGPLLQLTRHVRSIFADQPLRRFVHAFTIRSTTMELWIFDRSGLYSSGEFDIHREPEKLAHALVGYATMDDEAMGLDQSIEWEDQHRYVTVEAADGKDKRVELNRLIVRPRDVVCRGTTCFATGHGVAKFSWRSAKRQPSEVKHLKRALEKGVEGVASLVGYRDIATIADLRAGLGFSKKTRHAFRATYDLSGGYNRSVSDTNGPYIKRESAGEDALPFKRQRPNSQGSREAIEATASAKPSLHTPDQDDHYENRILSCLVISPAGRVICGFQNVRELLEALRDAIKAHQSLYVKGRILHGDVSSSNIIITDPETSGGFRGMLIDLDLSKEVDEARTGARHQTGTMQFMAIEVLRGIDHTYRHDLESFFYVLLWTCARCSWKKFASHGERPRAESILQKWDLGSFEDIASTKMSHMTLNSLGEIMDEFPQALQAIRPLCLRLRSVLFGDATRMYTSTPPGDPEQLYNRVIAAYDDILHQL